MIIIDIITLIVKTSVDFEHSKYFAERLPKEVLYEKYLNSFLKSIHIITKSWLGGNMSLFENPIDIMTDKELQEELEGEYIIYNIIGHTGEYIIYAYSNKDEAYDYYYSIESNMFTTEIMIIHEGKVLEYGGYIINYK